MHPMHVRYQAALRPEGADYSRGDVTDDKSFSSPNQKLSRDLCWRMEGCSSLAWPKN
jgi:hypothetical protein